MQETDELIRCVADYFGVTPDTITTGRRTFMRRFMRSTAAYLLRSTGRYSLSAIAAALKYGDHTSVLATLDYLKRERAASPVLDAQVRQAQLRWLDRQRELFGTTDKGA